VIASRLRAAALCGGLLLLAACDDLPGKPTREERYELPTKVTSFAGLYGENCAGCHGADGKLGPARSLNDPLYLAVASDVDLAAVIANGVPGTAMPAFSVAAGGFLTDQQIATLVREMRARWARPDDVAGVTLPPYAAPPGDAALGEQAFAAHCASCHGDDGTGGTVRGSVVDPSYLALVSDQSLRSTVIAGRPDLGMPDFRGAQGAPPMSEEQIANVVAWLAAQRREYPGRPFPRSD
jgi:cytochrome c oxidase cbb3-type subunit 3/ubiquinol-cytochrome c reductase cytochrome c subunit